MGIGQKPGSAAKGADNHDNACRVTTGDAGAIQLSRPECDPFVVRRPCRLSGIASNGNFSGSATVRTYDVEFTISDIHEIFAVWRPVVTDPNVFDEGLRLTAPPGNNLDCSRTLAAIHR